MSISCLLNNRIAALIIGTVLTAKAPVVRPVERSKPKVRPVEVLKA